MAINDFARPTLLGFILVFVMYLFRNPHIDQDVLKTPQIVIDDEGVFKYIVIECSISTYKLRYVRGSARFQYHPEIYQAFLYESGIKSCKCLGGGRIEHSKLGQSLRVFGKSETFG
jgi:phosphohistidine phosphatase